MSSVEIDIDDEMYEQLERIADEEGVSVQELVERIIIEYIEDIDENYNDTYDEED